MSEQPSNQPVIGYDGNPTPTGDFPSRRGPLIRIVLVTVLAQVVAGIGVGLIWLAWAPKSIAFVVAGAGGAKVLIPDETESQIAGDGRFLALTVTVGVIAALATWRLRRERGPLALSLLTIGSLLSALAARELGELLSGGHETGSINSAITLPLTLHASALIPAQAFVAVVIYVVLIGLSGDDLSGSASVAPLQSVTADSEA